MAGLDPLSLVHPDDWMHEGAVFQQCLAGACDEVGLPDPPAAPVGRLDPGLHGRAELKTWVTFLPLTDHEGRLVGIRSLATLEKPRP